MASYEWPPEGSGGGGGGGAAVAAAVVPILSGVSIITVTYSSTLAAIGVPVFSIINTVDSTPIFLQGIITFFSTHGFILTLNAPTDTANYSVSYIVAAAI